MLFKSKVKKPKYNTEGMSYEEAMKHIDDEYDRWETEFDAENKKMDKRFFMTMKILLGVGLTVNLILLVLFIVELVSLVSQT